jgi:hypothetical protein
MNETHIRDILFKDKTTKYNFAGVFARDEFNAIPLSHQLTPHSPSFFIVNLDTSNLPGSHWVAIEFHHRTKEAFYFDSYGLDPFYKDLDKKLTSEADVITWNIEKLQNLSTSVCGQYCILFCLLRQKGYSFKNVIDLLYHSDIMSSDTRDHVIHKLIKTLFKSSLKDFDTKVHDISAFTPVLFKPYCSSTFL